MSPFTPIGAVLGAAKKVAGAAKGAGGILGGIFGKPTDGGANVPVKETSVPVKAPDVGAKASKPGLFSRFGSAAKGKAAGLAGAGKEALIGKAKGLWAGTKVAGGMATESSRSGIGKTIIMFLAAGGSIFSSLFGAFFPTMVIGIIVLLVILSIFWFKGSTRVLGILLVIFLAVFAFWSTTTTGALLRAEAGTAMPMGFEATKGFTGSFNVLKQVLTGTYDPTQTWNSKEAEDEYAPYNDVGVKTEDIKPLRDTFIVGNDIVVQGRVSAKALPDDSDGTSVTIGASWADKIPDRTDFTSITCKPDKITKAQAYFSRFECTCYGFPDGCLNETNVIETHTIKITLDYSFTQHAGKQVYVAAYGDLSRLYSEDRDPADYYKITSDDTVAWQTKGPIDLGIGVLGEESGIIAAKTTGNEQINYLGISVRNNDLGKVTGIKSLVLTMPCEVTAFVDPDQKNNDFKVPTVPGRGGFVTEVPHPQGQPDLCQYVIKNGVDKQIASENEPLENAESHAVYLPFVADEKIFLQGSQISSFFVKVDLDFYYRDENEVAVTVKQG